MKHVLVLDDEELGWLFRAAHGSARRDAKSADRFGSDLDPRSTLAARVRVGPAVVEKLRALNHRAWDDAEADCRPGGKPRGL